MTAGLPSAMLAADGEDDVLNSVAIRQILGLKHLLSNAGRRLVDEACGYLSGRAAGFAFYKAVDHQQYDGADHRGNPAGNVALFVPAHLLAYKVSQE